MPIVFCLYWIFGRKNYKIQNIITVIASYVFYGWWNWRFLFLIIFSSLIDFFIGKKLNQISNDKSRKMLLILSLFANIGLLGFFKYFNFFIESFNQAFLLFGQEFKLSTLNIILPVGISFYTFQTMSYTIDVYKRKMSATKDIIAFLSFVSFFPQLVAGPIERANDLLPQFFKLRKFDYRSSVIGLKQILWGLFKKVVIADSCALVVNELFAQTHSYSGYILVLGLIFFSFQIYGDFSGYSDIAIGLARLFNINLSINFNFPYFSKNIIEFWRKWHISLTKWFRDYLYFPLGGSRLGVNKTIRNILIIFLVSGLWHGANWTFILWGLLHAIVYIIYKLMPKYQINQIKNKIAISFFSLTQIMFNYLLVSAFWVFFRAENIKSAFYYIKQIIKGIIINPIEIININFWLHYPSLIVMILFFIFIERRGVKRHVVLAQFDHFPKLLRWSIYSILMISIIYNMQQPQEFIYFQF